jgi:hypothetical protein
VKRIIVVALGVVLAFTMAMPMALGQVGQDAQASGKVDAQASETVRELVAAWWQWALSKPEATNPLVGSYKGGPKCNGRPVSDTPGTGMRWFLGGSLAEEPVTRTCTAPWRRQFFFPVVNVVIIPDPGETQKQLLAQARAERAAQLRGADVKVSVDGRSVGGERRLRAATPFFTAKVPQNGLLAPGSYRLVAAGLWVKIGPLPLGKHTIRSKISGGSFDQDITYHLTVVNDKSRLPPK